MTDRSKSKQELIQELVSLRKRIAELEQSELEHKRAEKTLHEAERQQRLIYEYLSDVIFTLDCDLRVTSVSTSVERHLGYRTEELVGRQFNDINVLAPESLEVALKNALQALAGGTAPATEYVFIRKDGTRIIGEVSVSPCVEDGKIVGLISVARDITERKRVEEALSEKSQFIASLMRAMPVAVFYKDKEGRYLGCNDTFTDIMGVTSEQIKGKTVHELWPSELAEKYHHMDLELIRNRRHQVYEFQVKAKDGQMHPVIYAKDVYLDKDGEVAGLVGAFLDITEHKRVESIMQARLRLLEFAISHSMDEFLTATLDEIEALTGSAIGFYHFLESDQKTLSLQNWSTNTLKNMCTAEGKSSHYDIAKAGVWVDCVYERRPVIHNDYASLPHRKGMPDGHAPVVREVVVPIFRGNLIKAIIGVGNKSTNYDESDIGIVSQLGDLSWDITERKRMEEELSRVNRALQMLSNTNQVLMHITDEATLLNEVCQIAVDVGGYRLAWVGFAEHDEAKTLRPVAHAGFDSGYIESAKITWADNERGRGPGGTAIRTGQPCIVRKIPEDPSFAPWREEATRRGYKSIIALPLTIEGQTFGAMGIYSVEADVFNVKEVEILIELATDLAFGITVLHTRAKRDLAEEALRYSEKEKTILNQIANVFLTIPDEEMYGEVLNVVLRVMNSNFGIFGYIGGNGGLVIPSLTRDIWRECQIPGKSIVFPSDSWGESLWGRAIREKRVFYSDGPFRTPEGHVHVDHFIAAPVVFGQKSIGLISVANKEGGYIHEDKILLERITGYISPILNARLQRDMQERKRGLAVEELRKSEEKYRGVVENIGIGIAVISPNMEILALNNQMKEWFPKIDVSKYPACYKAFNDPPGETVCSYCPTDKTIEDGRVHESITEKPAGNETRNYRVVSSPLRDNDGKINAAIVMIEDITERIRIERELLKADKLESVGILAGGIAHDFNNILTSISGNISMAKMQVEPSHKIFKLLSAAEKASVRAQGLTIQLLTFAKGGMPIKETASIKNLIKESFLFVLRGSKSECKFQISEDLWPVEADLGQISQVISNIAINANQAMPEGGIIRIEAENMMPEKMNGIPVKPGRYIHISIKDQGVGIDEKHLSKIFDPYFTTKQTGSGLGLAMAYSIINKHSGHISVDSLLGAGTTFHIYLPASDKGVRVKEEAVLLKGCGRILVMDDDKPLRKMAGEMLAMLGYESEFARDGYEAIDRYKKAMESEKPYDAVILDLTIPGGMGGKEAIKILLEIDPEVKAIVYSGYAEGEVMTNYLEYGFKGMIPKPFDAYALGKVLNDVLEYSKSIKET
jgi:PAS domain S-box-containing protein